MSEENAAPPLPERRIRRRGIIRNWRMLLIELAIVVVGVGLALAAQQTADWLRWESEVARAREVIATELARNLGNATLRLKQLDCIDKRLDELAFTLDAAAKTGILPPLGAIGTPPRSIFPTGAWEGVMASQTATHFSREDLARLASLYKWVQRLEEFSTREADAWSELHTMTGPGRRLDSASEAALRQALSQARSVHQLMGLMSLNLFRNARLQNLPFNRSDLDTIQSVVSPAMCAPIGAPPASYGHGMIAPLLQQWRAEGGHLPDMTPGAP